MGDVSKPYPILVFYTFNSVDTTISADTTVEDFFSRKIQVSKSEFYHISEAIQKINLGSEFPQLKDSVAVIIRRNSQTQILKSASVRQIRQIFDSIMAGLRDHSDNKIIQRYIDQFKRRLGVAVLHFKRDDNIGFECSLLIRKTNTL